MITQQNAVEIGFGIQRRRNKIDVRMCQEGCEETDNWQGIKSFWHHVELNGDGRSNSKRLFCDANTLA